MTSTQEKIEWVEANVKLLCLGDLVKKFQSLPGTVKKTHHETITEQHHQFRHFQLVNNVRFCDFVNVELVILCYNGDIFRLPAQCDTTLDIDIIMNMLPFTQIVCRAYIIDKTQPFSYSLTYDSYSDPDHKSFTNVFHTPLTIYDPVHKLIFNNALFSSTDMPPDTPAELNMIKTKIPCHAVWRYEYIITEECKDQIQVTIIGDEVTDIQNNAEIAATFYPDRHYDNFNDFEWFTGPPMKDYFVQHDKLDLFISLLNEHYPKIKIRSTKKCYKQTIDPAKLELYQTKLTETRDQYYASICTNLYDNLN